MKYPKFDNTLDKLMQNQIKTPDTPVSICPRVISKTDRDLSNDQFSLPKKTRIKILRSSLPSLHSQYKPRTLRKKEEILENS